MKIKPLHDRVLIKRLEEEEKTKGGIIIPDTAKEKPMMGKVTAVGEGKILESGEKAPATLCRRAFPCLSRNSPSLF